VKASDILALARSEYLDDAGTIQLWGDTSLLSKLNDAEIEAATRAELIRDTDTLVDAYGRPVCQIPVVSGTGEYIMSPNIIRVHSLRLLSQEPYFLTHVTLGWLREFYPQWETASGSPLFYITDKGRIRIIPAPDEDDTAYMDVRRLPLNEMVLTEISIQGVSNISFDAATKTISMSSGNFILAGLRPGFSITVEGSTSNNSTFYLQKVNKTELVTLEALTDEAGTSATIKAYSRPEIPEEYHKKLIDWICHLAYSKQDAETEDARKTTTHEARFERTFGPPPSARAMKNRLTRPRNTEARSKEFGFT